MQDLYPQPFPASESSETIDLSETQSQAVLDEVAGYLDSLQQFHGKLGTLVAMLDKDPKRFQKLAFDPETKRFQITLSAKS